MNSFLKKSSIAFAIIILLTSCTKKVNITNNSALKSQSTIVNKPPQTRANYKNPIISRRVNTIVAHPIARRGASQDDFARTLSEPEISSPKNNKVPKSLYAEITKPVMDNAYTNSPEYNKALQTTIQAGTTTTNLDNTGNALFIPADPHGAAGPNHVVNVFNTSIEFYQKNGTRDYSDTLQNFFSDLSPANFTFDPKVIYDQFEDRWVVVTLELTDTGNGDAANTSQVLIAISDDSNPNGSWTVTEINTSISISGDMHWLDYPGLAVDEEAIYITGNMFQYFGGTSNPGSNGGNRLIIIDKGVVGGFYAGGTVSASIYDPATTLGAFSVTQMPAQIYGTAPANVGTWLVGYSALASSGNSAVQLIRIDNPLGIPTFTQQFALFGVVDGLTISIPDSPQSGTVTSIDSGDRRVLDAVWRNNSLYFTTEVQSNDVNNLNQATAFWGQINTSNLNLPAFTQGNIIGGENDIGAGTYTTYPSIAVNADGGIVVGFTASNSNIFPSSYFVHQSPTDPLNSMRPAQLISAGEAFYIRTFGGAKNRWGDYSSTSVDPDESCFWVYNKHASTQGDADSGGVEFGRFGTTHAQFCNDAPTAGNNSITVDENGTITIVNNGDDTVLNNDSDPDADDTLTTLIISNPTDSSSFTLNLDGTFSYTHNGANNPTDSFVYEACDDGSPIKCDQATVNIAINLMNDDPNAIDDVTFEIGEDAVFSNFNLTNNDTDADGDDVEISAINTSGTTGIVSIRSNNDAIRYEPNGQFETLGLGQTAQDSLTYTVTDGNGGSDTALVTITINGANDQPVANDNNGITVGEDDASANFNLTSNDSDIDGDDVEISSIDVTGTLGLVSIRPNNDAISYDPNGQFDSLPMGTSAQDTLTYTVNDGNGGTDTANVTVTVNGVNDSPTANVDAITVDEGANSSVLASTESSVLSNDTDVDDATLTATINSAPTRASAFTLNSNGTFSYTHNGGETLTDSFTYDACDDELPTPACDTATVTITINPINDAPIANDDSAVVFVGNSVTIVNGGDTSLLQNDSDNENNNLSLTVIPVTLPVNGNVTLNSNGTFNYTHNGNSATSDSFVYQVCDDGSPIECSNASVTISILSVDIFSNGFED